MAKNSQPKNKPGKSRRKAADGNQIDDLVALQQRVVGRYAQFASDMVKRVSEGDLRLSNWADDYSTVWGGLSSDLTDATRIVSRGTAGRTLGKTEKRSTHPLLGYSSWLCLQQSVLSRAASYWSGVGRMAVAGGTEPREWISEGANFWSDVIADVGDWARRESGEELRPSDEWVPRIRHQMKAGKLTTSVPINIPAEAFPESDDTKVTVTLIADVLTRVGGGVVFADKNRTLVPATISRSTRRATLQLFDLPQVVAGDVYAGFVWAVWSDQTNPTKQTKHLIATVEIEVV